jgi:sulfonate transport system substrate-binding protein
VSARSHFAKERKLRIGAWRAADRRPSANNFRALYSAEDRVSRLGIIKSTFDVNEHIEPKCVLKVMKEHPEVFSDLPPIREAAVIATGCVFRP